MTLLSGLEGMLCLVDTVLLLGHNQVEHDARCLAAPKSIEAGGATLN